LVVVREPLEFGHNFLYVTCALFEALLFIKLTEPRMWFTLGAITVRGGWLLFISDFRLIRASESNSTGQASKRLPANVRRDQRWNVILSLPDVFRPKSDLRILYLFVAGLFSHAQRSRLVDRVPAPRLFRLLILFRPIYVDLAPLIAEAHGE